MYEITSAKFSEIANSSFCGEKSANEMTKKKNDAAVNERTTRNNNEAKRLISVITSGVIHVEKRQ